eukprot:5985023-Karenia_brevis.AAC.1
MADPDDVWPTVLKVRDMIPGTLTVNRAVPPLLGFLDTLAKSMYQLIASTIKGKGSSVPNITTTSFTQPLSPEWSMTINDVDSKKYNANEPSHTIVSGTTEMENGIAIHKIMLSPEVPVTQSCKLNVADMSTMLGEMQSRLDSLKASRVNTARAPMIEIEIYLGKAGTILPNYGKKGKGRGKGKG